MSEPLENREEMLARFREATGGRHYQWATRHNIPRHVVVSLLNGSYAPQQKTRDLIEERTGLSSRWLIHGEGPQWLPGREPASAQTGPTPASQSALSEAGQAAGQVLEQDGHIYKPDLLEGVVRGVEEFIRAHDLDPSPEKKAVAISLMYRYALMKGGPLTPKDIADFFKLAA